MFHFYSKNQQAMDEIRAPIFEDKVVDFIAELAEVTDRVVDRGDFCSSTPMKPQRN